MKVSLEYFKSEIRYTYRVLGNMDVCQSQNAIDINGWYNDGYINDSERQYLIDYNKQFYFKIIGIIEEKP